MFGHAYVVDIISDGQQVYDSGIFADVDQARECFNERVSNTVSASKAAGATGREYTVRLIDNGEIRSEATVGDNGAILDSLSR